MLEALRSGSFVTRQRMRVYSALLLVAYAAAIIALLATADGIVDAAGRPLGTDFANIYAAGTLARDGTPALAYDWPGHHAAQRAVSGQPDIPYFPWNYPPPFLFVAVALAALPYLGALILYQSITLGAYLGVVRHIAGERHAWLPALAFPAVFVNVTHGHDGLLAAALLGGALLVLDRRPLLAGALLGGFCFKPEFAPLIFLVLAATARWRVIAAAAATMVALGALTWMAFGSDAFAAFWQSLPLAQKVVAEGARGFHKTLTMHGALRLLGMPPAIASLAQLLTMLGVAAALVALWRSRAAFELQAAALAIGVLVTTPHALDYDLVILAPAIAFLAAHGLRQGFAPYELSLLAALWVLPLLARSLAVLTTVSLSPFVLLLAIGFLLHRAAIVPWPALPPRGAR